MNLREDFPLSFFIKVIRVSCGFLKKEIEVTSKIERVIKMAKKLADLMLKNDDNGRQIRCLVVEDYVTGGISKVRDRSQFESLIQTTDEMLLTKVYEPDMADRDRLMKLIQSSTDADLQAQLSEADVLFELLRLTDLELDPTELESNKALMNEILKRPNALFLAIKAELEVVLIEVVASFHDVANAYRAMPEEWLTLSDEIMSAQANLVQLKEEIEQTEARIETYENELVN